MMYLFCNLVWCDEQHLPFTVFHPNSKNITTTNLVDDQMLILSGCGNDNGKGYNDIGILSTSTRSWITQYTSNPAWLSGDLSASPHDVLKNTTGSYSSDARSNDRDLQHTPFIQEQNTTAIYMMIQIKHLITKMIVIIRMVIMVIQV